MIFDAHLHLPCFDPDSSLNDKKLRLLNDIEKLDILGGIVIADSEKNSPIGNNEECLMLFNDCNNIFVMAGISPLIDYDDQLRFISENIKYGKIIGIKLYPGHEPYFVNDNRLEKVFKLCETVNIPMAIHTGWDNSEYNDPKYIAKIAQEHPKLKIVICHLWYPHISYCIKTTENNENIFYDISSLAHEQEKITEITLELSKIAQKYPDRLIFGSDYSACNIQLHIDLVNNLDILEKGKELIRWKNAIKVYNLKNIMA